MRATSTNRMILTRRTFIKNSAVVSLSVIMPKIALATIQESGWKKICKQWMALLLPPDEYGPGADSPVIWKSLLELIDNKPETLQWFKLGFRRLERIGLPKTNEQLSEMLQQNRPYSKFLWYIKRLFVEYYYATEVGWRELGMTEPPQPTGFKIKG